MQIIKHQTTDEFSWSTKRVLVTCRPVLQPYIENNDENQSLFLSFVQSMDAAIDCIKNTRFDFVISEINLIDGDIWRLSEAIKSRHLCQIAPPVIAMLFEQQTISLEKLAQSKSVYLFNAELPMTGLTAFLDHVEQIQNKIINHYNVLLIEDDLSVVDAVQHVLHADFNLDHASLGELGLSKWMTKQHDLVILDLSLPDMSGQTVLKEIMRLNQRQPVIILTGYPSTNNLKQCLLLGAQLFLEKPIAPDLLIKECFRALNFVDLSQLHQGECNNTETHRLIRAAKDYLITGQISASKALLDKARLLEGEGDYIDDDTYF